MKYVMLTLLTLMTLTACKQEEVKVYATPQAAQLDEHRVHLLFENEGCKVWAFHDAMGVGDAVYSDCSGHTAWTESVRTGKTTRTEHHSCATGK